MVFSYAVRQEYVGWGSIDLLSFLVCALLEVNDQLHAPTDILPLTKPWSALTTGQETGFEYEEREPPPVEVIEFVSYF
jgi:hypothetical protein